MWENDLQAVNSCDDTLVFPSLGVFLFHQPLVTASLCACGWLPQSRSCTWRVWVLVSCAWLLLLLPALCSQRGSSKRVRVAHISSGPPGDARERPQQLDTV